MRVLHLKIHEPLPVRILPLRTAENDHAEAARRYRAIVLTTLRQLGGLENTRLRLLCDPEDADEAIRFWLLPRLADRWQRDGEIFRSSGWEIDFEKNHPEETDHVEAHGEVLCPFLSARWVHTAMLGIERGSHRVIGPAIGGGEYFRADPPATPNALETRILPELPIIHDSEGWNMALASPLGPALKKAWENEI